MTLDAGELADLLRLSQRSQAWLARKLEVRAETVWHWLHEDWEIPSTRHDRIRGLLSSTCPACGHRIEGKEA